MRNQKITGYLLKEYGSWSVLIVSYITGLAVSRSAVSWLAIPLFLALGLLINSKQAYTLWARKGDGRAFLVFAGQIATAAVLLWGVFGNDVLRLLPLLIFPAAYIVMNRFAGEHFLLTEVLGFALISLAAILAKFLLVGGMDVRLFIAVALYFTAGIFKIKTLLKRRIQDRILTVLYILFVVYAYDRFHIPLIILLPLLDNLAAAVYPYQVKLKVTGWVEVAKSLLFLVLMVLFF